MIKFYDYPEENLIIGKTELFYDGYYLTLSENDADWVLCENDDLLFSFSKSLSETYIDKLYVI